MWHDIAESEADVNATAMKVDTCGSSPVAWGAILRPYRVGVEKETLELWKQIIFRNLSHGIMVLGVLGKTPHRIGIDLGFVMIWGWKMSGMALR